MKSYCPIPVLKSLYFSIFNSHLSYGLAVWGNASKMYIDKINLLQKRAVKAVSLTPNATDINYNSIFYDLKILKLDDQLQLQLSSLMWDYDHNTLPLSLQDYFKRVNLVHNYSTRSSVKGKLYCSKVNTVKHGIKSFKYQGTKILNNLKNLNIYQNTGIKHKFLKDLKLLLLSEYLG